MGRPFNSPFANRYSSFFHYFVRLAFPGFLAVLSPRYALTAAVLLVGSQAKLASTGDEAVSKDGLKIGGQPVVQLMRRSSANAAGPEFTSVTILPGRGMNLFQITAKLPGKGEVHVLASPSLEEAAQQLNGGADDVHGVK